MKIILNICLDYLYYNNLNSENINYFFTWITAIYLFHLSKYDEEIYSKIMEKLYKCDLHSNELLNIFNEKEMFTRINWF